MRLNFHSQKLSFLTEQKYTQNISVMNAFLLCYVFYEVFGSILHKIDHVSETIRIHVLKFELDLVAKTKQIYGPFIDNCFGFINWGCIAMARWEARRGRGVLQRLCYFRHKRIHCQRYETNSTLNGVLFYS